MSEVLLTDLQVSERWNKSRKTLANWRSLNVGPPFVRIGRAIRYRESDINTYEEGNRTCPST